MQRGRALIAAAGRLIQESGGDDFTMQKVASEAGLSLRVVYQLFSGKDDLLVALVEETQIVFARLLARHASTRSDPLERLGAALYFATDPRQHTDRSYNVAVTRFIVGVSASAPEHLGHARKPIVDVFTTLIDDARVAGQIDECDPATAACQILLAYIAYEHNLNLGNSIGAPLPGNEQLIRFGLLGLGARLPAGWEQQFRLSDAEADRSRLESERLAGTKAKQRRAAG